MKKYDVVYFLKPDEVNNEARWSLRSIEKNMDHGAVWFYGGQPSELIPDRRAPMIQSDRQTKWQRVREMLAAACENDEITQKFWLMNDDFFVLQKMESEGPYFGGDLRSHILSIEYRHGNITPYTAELRTCEAMLEETGLPTFNYALHIPMLIDRKKMAEALQAFPGCPMFRSIYGNYAEIGGSYHEDVKVIGQNELIPEAADFASTTDESFGYGAAGAQIRSMFPEKCKYEI